tara:strand:+ start:1092 stop:1406 length:315 start_codon:yes stop_codon:yes gene_type:complete
MPTSKQVIATYNQGTIIEYEVTVKTSWAQIVGPGPVFLRCDDVAMETGVGTWCIDDSTKRGIRPSRTWEGKLSPRAMCEFKSLSQDLWVKDDRVFRYDYEKDVS